MKRLANFIIDKRLIVLVAMILMTLFFVYLIATKLTVKTVFSDLLPQNHEYTNLHNEIRGTFGGGNQVYIMVQVRDRGDGGKYDDVFNTETLNIIRSITRDLLKFNAVDRYKIMSLASDKVKNIEMTSGGMSVKSMMWPEVPKTPEQLKELRKNVYGSPMAYPGLVSLDSKKALITVDFFEEQLDYRVSYKELKALREKYEDKNHIIAIAGEPLHLGYVDYYVKDVLKILACTVIAMMAVFFIYFRTMRGMFLPMLAATVSAIWGLGFLTLLKFNLDPLVLVFPFLIAAMAASHSVQVVKRYMEEAYITGEVREACKNVISSLFVPGMAGVLTDASGIFVIAITPIPILQKICLSCAFWAFATAAIAFLLVPILLSYMPLKARPEGAGMLDKLLKGVGVWLTGWGKYTVLVVSILLLIWSMPYINRVTIGNAVPGSEVLWPWHRYNVDSFRITFAMPMLNPLYVIVEGEKNMDIANTTVIRDILNFLRYMERTPDMRVMVAMSYLMAIPTYNQMMRDNDFNCYFTPTNDDQLRAIYRNLVDGAGPGTWDMYVDASDKKTNIIIYCRDKTTETIKIVTDRVKEYIRDHSVFGKRSRDVERHGFDKFVYWLETVFRGAPAPMPEKPPVPGVPQVHYRMAGGTVGIQAAINEALVMYGFWTFILAILTVFIFCAIAFKSIFAGILNCLPLILANSLVYALMVLSDPHDPHDHGDSSGSRGEHRARR